MPEFLFQPVHLPEGSGKFLCRGVLSGLVDIRGDQCSSYAIYCVAVALLVRVV